MLDRDFAENEPAIRAITYKLAVTTGHLYEIQELQSKANEIFVDAWYSYEEDSGASFRTWLITKLKFGLLNFINRRDPSFQPQDEEDDWDRDFLPSRHAEWNPRDRLIFKEEIEQMSEEAKFIVGIVLSSPVEILGLRGTETPKQVRGVIFRHLREVGWAWSTIWSTFGEIKKTVARL